MELDDFNISFHRGDTEFLKFILNKFIDDLPYNGVLSQWSIMNNYGDRVPSLWTLKGRVPPRAFNLIHKDLCILRQKNPSIPTIQELFEEFNKSLTK